MLRDGSLSLGLRLCAAFLSLVTLAVFGRVLSPEDFGYFATVMAILGLLAPVCGLGWPLTLVRYFGRGESSKGLIKLAFRQSVGLSIFVVILGAIFLREKALILGLAILPAYVAIDLVGAILRARGSLVRALAPRDILWRAALLVAGFIAMRFPAGEQTSVLLTIAAPLIVLIAGAQMLLLGPFGEAPLPDGVGKVKSRIWVSNLSGTLFANLDTLAVGAFCGVEIAGGYFAASRLSSIIVFVHNAVGLAVGPRLARHCAAANTEDLRADMRRAALMAGGPAVCVFMLFGVSGEVFLRMISENAADMYLVLLLLALGQVVNGLTGASGLFLAMSSREGLVARVSLQSLFVGALTISLAAYFYGPIGAACATFCVQTWNEARLWLAARSVLSQSSFQGVTQ